MTHVSRFFFWKLRNQLPDSSICLVDPSTAFVIQFEKDQDDLLQQIRCTGVLTADHVVIPVNDNLDVDQVNGGTHWALLVCTKTVAGIDCKYVDSLFSKGTERAARSICSKLSKLRRLSIGSFSALECQKQTNSSDCGIFVLAFAEQILRSLVEKRVPVLKTDPDAL